jgi:hypothetical protein
MRWLSFVVLVGFAGCGGDGDLFGASSSSTSGNGGAGGSSSTSGSSSSGDASSSSSSTSGSSSTSSSGAGAGGSSSSSTSGSSSTSSSGVGGSSSSSSSSSGATCVCPPYQDCKDGTSTCWGCTKNNTQCLFYAPKTQGVECDTGYVPPAAECTYIGQQPEFPFKPLYCCAPK